MGGISLDRDEQREGATMRKLSRLSGGLFVVILVGATVTWATGTGSAGGGTGSGSRTPGGSDSGTGIGAMGGSGR
jgi:hypothetical protein